MARVVIVDDASFMRGSLEFIIKTDGHEVVGQGKDGEEREPRNEEKRQPQGRLGEKHARPERQIISSYICLAQPILSYPAIP